MKVYEAVANAFVKEGTSTVFGLLGDGNLLFWATLSGDPAVKMIDVRDEGCALSMAEGWANATGKVGVCSVTRGPGISRMTTSLVAATRTRTPLVVCTGKTAFNNETNFQFIDQDKLVSATGARYIEVLTPSFAENAVRQAFYRAKLESRPVVLCVPDEIQQKECDGDGDAYQPSTKMFAGQQRIRPDLERLNEAVKIITESKKPVVVLGRGALELQTKRAAERLAKRIGALVATTLLAKGVLGDSEYHAGISGLFSTRAVMQLFAEADCVIAIGASLNPRTIAGGYLYPQARIIQIDVAPHIVMGNDQGADCYLQGDATVTTHEIDDMLAKKGMSQAGYRTAATRKILSDADRDPAEFEIEAGTVDPRDAVRVIDERLPSSIGLVTGVGHFFSFPVMLMKKPRPLHMFATGFGSIGQGLSNGIGVAVAVDEPVLCVEGDGGAMQSIQELDTAARLGVKLLYVIMNDEGFGQEYYRFIAQKRNPKVALVRSPNFGVVGQGFGCRGRTARTIAEVETGIDEFLAGDGPMVLDIRISRNVPSIPFRRMEYGQDV